MLGEPSPIPTFYLMAILPRDSGRPRKTHNLCGPQKMERVSTGSVRMLCHSRAISVRILPVGSWTKAQGAIGVGR